MILNIINVSPLVILAPTQFRWARLNQIVIFPTSPSHESLLVNDLLTRYEKLGPRPIARPRRNSSEPVEVVVGLRLIALDVDEKQQMLTTSVWLRLVIIIISKFTAIWECSCMYHIEIIMNFKLDFMLLFCGIKQIKSMTWKPLCCLHKSKSDILLTIALCYRNPIKVFISISTIVCHTLSKHRGFTVFLQLWYDEYLEWDPDDYGGLKSVILPHKSVWMPENIALVNT